ncbi:hypothetical protein AOQ84DRAFT_342149 [Glonium stellatum]|uniref:CHY-type domain-containing protein n=1 Tax=Glonium stellatum TaxID=574774 RepID=A0A8E2JRW0_9PEZI|nr:hypothetical protein AOQ84DRAFT_342149 [Glonium stellatum]
MQHAQRRSRPSRVHHRSVVTDAPSSRQVPQDTTAAGSQFVAPAVDTARIAHRPIPPAQIDDPRGFQLSQIRRRFSPREQDDSNGTVLTFQMRPSDPDFPFDIDALDCLLRVPFDYPESGKPSLTVNNPNMERGYQINVERGFDTIVANARASTLLNHMNALDKQLETLLVAQKADTIKIVPNFRKQEKPLSELAPKNELPYLSATAAESPPSPSNTPVTYSGEQKAQAQSRREAETRQLESRLGRLPKFTKSKDGLEYTVPIEPRKRSELPEDLKAISTINLIVPTLYNLEKCRIELNGVDGEAKMNVEKAFQERALHYPQLTLTNHINYLSQNMLTMAASKENTKLEITRNVPQPQPQPTEAQGLSNPSLSSGRSALPPYEVPDRAHIVTIPRPPEWDTADNDVEDTDDSSESYTDESCEEEEEGEAGASDKKPQNTISASTPERGILVSFPQMELYGIELLELVTISITIKCDRCKDTMDVANIKDAGKLDGLGTRSGTRAEICKKCAIPLGIGFRANLMHTNSVRAGYLDLDGCTVVDLLPSVFVPTCSECSTPYPAAGVVSVRGETSAAYCRECHRKMTFRIPEVKFLLVSASAVRASRAPVKRKPAEKLGIVAGTELPERGRCTHYKKSYRWFRFSCCNKVFPCDRCHDQAIDHPIEHANRMICGFCSREQNYRPKDCGLCHAWLTVRPGKGFWEGGQGTRDKTRMSRKDPRKYKRQAGTNRTT